MSKFTITAEEQDGWFLLFMRNRAGRTWAYNQKCFEFPTDCACIIEKARIEAMLAKGEKLDAAYWTEMA